MPVPRKGATRVNYRDTQYIWVMQRHGNQTKLQLEASAAVDGRMLVVELPRIVNPKMIEESIDWARKNGWNPGEAGEPFCCKYLRGQFTRVEVDS